MAVIGQFGYWKFEVSSKYVRSFKNLQIVGECETEDKTADAQKYVSAKNGKPIQITLTVVLCAYLGADVHGDVVKLIDTAQRSGQGYFYVQSKKLFPFMLMLTKAEVKNIGLSPSGQWISCEVSLTLKQSSKDWILGAPPSSGGGGNQNSGGGGSGGSGGGGGRSSSGSKKASVKSTSTTKRTPMTGVSAKSIAAVAAARNKKRKNALTGKKSNSSSTTRTIKSAQSAIKKNTTAAKKATAAKKKTKSGGGGGSKVRRRVMKY